MLVNFLKSDGVVPFSFLKVRLKLLFDPKPHSIAMDSIVIVFDFMDSNICLAASTRYSFIYSGKVFCNLQFKIFDN